MTQPVTVLVSVTFHEFAGTCQLQPPHGPGKGLKEDFQGTLQGANPAGKGPVPSRSLQIPSRSFNEATRHLPAALPG